MQVRGPMPSVFICSNLTSLSVLCYDQVARNWGRRTKSVVHFFVGRIVESQFKRTDDISDRCETFVMNSSKVSSWDSKNDTSDNWGLWKGENTATMSFLGQWISIDIIKQ